MNAQIAEPLTDTAPAVQTPAVRARDILKADDVAPRLIALADESKHITSITNADGAKQVHAKRMTLKTERIALEKSGKAARDDANAFAKAVIAEEDRLVALIKPEELRLQVLQDGWEAKIEAEKEAERQRLQAITDNAREVVQWFRDQPLEAVGKTAAEITDMLRMVEQAPIADLPEQFTREADAAKTLAIAKLGDMYAARKGFELEQIELQAERDALEQKRREQEEQQAIAAKLAEDERAELESLLQIVRDNVGASSGTIIANLAELLADPPPDPSDAVLAAWDDTVARLQVMRDEALARETEIEQERAQRADRERIAGIHRRIEAIRHLQQQAVGKSSEAIAVLQLELEETPADFQEFTADAVMAQDETRATLKQMHAAAVERERLDEEFRAQAAADQQRKVDEANARRAEQERAEREAAELQQAETQRRIAECTLLEAAEAAVEELEELGAGETIPARMLRSAIERAA